MHTRFGYQGKNIEIIMGSITNSPANAIVVPANPDLEFVGIGIQGFVAHAGGIDIFKHAEHVADEYAKKNGYTTIEGMRGKVPLYSAHLTTGALLPAKYVIHSVALGYNRKDRLFCNPEVIAESTRNVLELGRQKKLQSIAFPALGTGLYDVPLLDSASAMIREFKNHLVQETSLETLSLFLFGEQSYSKVITYLQEGPYSNELPPFSEQQ